MSRPYDILYNLINKVQQKEEIANEITIAATTGTIVNKRAVKHGKVIHVMLVVKNSSVVNAGSNMFYGTQTGHLPAETIMAGRGVAYAGNSVMVGQISQRGEVLVRVTGANLAANTEVYVPIVYIEE